MSIQENSKFTPVVCKRFNRWFLGWSAAPGTHFHQWSRGLNPSWERLVSSTFMPLLCPWSYLAMLAIIAIQSSQLSKTTNGFLHPAAFSAPSSSKRAGQQGRSFLFSPNPISSHPVSNVCSIIRNFLNGSLLATKGHSAGACASCLNEASFRHSDIDGELFI